MIQSSAPGMAAMLTGKSRCPTCGSRRTERLSMPSGHGTLRQHEQGSSELAHISKTTSGLSFSGRASNTRAYICIFVGGCGLVVALIMGLKLRNSIGPEILVGLVGGLTLLTGVFARRPGHNVADSEGHLDRPRVCSRCGRVWPT